MESRTMKILLMFFGHFTVIIETDLRNHTDLYVFDGSGFMGEAM